MPSQYSHVQLAFTGNDQLHTPNTRGKTCLSLIAGLSDSGVCDTCGPQLNNNLLHGIGNRVQQTQLEASRTPAEWNSQAFSPRDSPIRTSATSAPRLGKMTAISLFDHASSTTGPTLIAADTSRAKQGPLRNRLRSQLSLLITAPQEIKTLASAHSHASLRRSHCARG